MKISAGFGLLNKLNSLNEVLKATNADKIKVEMTGTEYKQLHNNYLKEKQELALAACKEIKRDYDVKIKDLDNKVYQYQDEVAKLQKRCEGLGNAVGKWKIKAEGSKGSKGFGYESADPIKRLRFRIGKRSNDAFADITIETDMPINSNTTNAIEYFSSVEARTLYPGYPPGGDLKIIEIYSTPDSSSWYAVLQGTDWRNNVEINR